MGRKREFLILKLFSLINIINLVQWFIADIS